MGSTEEPEKEPKKMLMDFFKEIGVKEGTSRLFVGGLHGKEGLSTIHAFKNIKNINIVEGNLVLCNLPPSPYMSTLDPLYYQSGAGKKILYLINHYQPTVYVEAHCYKKSSYPKLISPQRRTKAGVPPLIELENGVLIGSVSPFIRTSLFKREDVCITMEMPCDPPPESLDVYVNVLRIIASSSSRDDLEKKMKKLYPAQVETARKYAREFFGDYPPF